VNIEKAARECAEYYRRHLHDETTLYPASLTGSSGCAPQAITLP